MRREEEGEHTWKVLYILAPPVAQHRMQPEHDVVLLRGPG